MSNPSSRRAPGAPRKKPPSTGRATPSGAETAPLDHGGHDHGVDVEIRRSARRRRTVSAYRDGDRVVILMPARLSRAEEREWVETMLARLAAQERRRRPTSGRLQARARQLSERYLDGRAVPATVRWVDNQASRWGSCTPADRSIRLSTRLQGMPGWVVDYVLVHELVHLIEPGHTPRFWSLVGRYSRTERARGYLEGVATAAQLPLSDLADLSDLSDLADVEDASDDDPGPGPDRGAPDDEVRAGAARIRETDDAVQQVLFGTAPARRRLVR